MHEFNPTTIVFVTRSVKRWSLKGALTRSKKTRLFCKECGALQRVTGNDQNIATLECRHERHLFEPKVVEAFTNSGEAA
jgi:hypothetical protein